MTNKKVDDATIPGSVVYTTRTFDNTLQEANALTQYIARQGPNSYPPHSPRPSPARIAPRESDASVAPSTPCLSLIINVGTPLYPPLMRLLNLAVDLFAAALL